MKRVVISLILLLSGAALLIAAARVPGFASLYTREIYPYIERVIGGFSGLFPFALAEILAYILFIAGAVYIIKNILHPAALLGGILPVVSLLFFLYAACCGVNYHSETFAETIGLEVREYDEADLVALSELLAAGVGDNVPGEGGSEREESRSAMIKLGERYPALSGYYPLPKPVAWSWLLSIQQVTGVYSPFSVEALYNRDIPRYSLPHTLCHELSHLRGFMLEDEANFIAFLACIGSDDEAFRYSGFLTGFVYAGRALRDIDPEAYRLIYSSLPDEAKEDIASGDAYWAQFEGHIADTQDRLNDMYLRASGDERGIASYDYFTLLMLDYYSSGLL